MLEISVGLVRCDTSVSPPRPPRVARKYASPMSHRAHDHRSHAARSTGATAALGSRLNRAPGPAPIRKSARTACFPGWEIGAAPPHARSRRIGSRAGLPRRPVELVRHLHRVAATTLVITRSIPGGDAAARYLRWLPLRPLGQRLPSA